MVYYKVEGVGVVAQEAGVVVECMENDNHPAVLLIHLLKEFGFLEATKTHYGESVLIPYLKGLLKPESVP